MLRTAHVVIAIICEQASGRDDQDVGPVAIFAITFHGTEAAQYAACASCLVSSLYFNRVVFYLCARQGSDTALARVSREELCSSVWIICLTLLEMNCLASVRSVVGEPAKTLGC